MKLGGGARHVKCVLRHRWCLDCMCQPASRQWLDQPLPPAHVERFRPVITSEGPNQGHCGNSRGSPQGGAGHALFRLVSWWTQVSGVLCDTGCDLGSVASVSQCLGHARAPPTLCDAAPWIDLDVDGRVLPEGWPEIGLNPPFRRTTQ